MNSTMVTALLIHTTAWASAPTAAISLDLAAGNNLVSFPVLPEDTTVAHVLGSLSAKALHIQGDGVIFVRMADGRWVGNAEGLERDRGYWIDMAEAVTLDIVGSATEADLNIQLKGGTSLVAYTCQDALPLPDALSEAYEHLITGVTGSGEAAVWTGTDWAGSLRDLVPGNGYYLNTEEPVTDFSWACHEADGIDETAYGCLDPFATNHDPEARVSDHSCTYALPKGWEDLSDISTDQAYYLFNDVRVDGQPTDSTDLLGIYAGAAFLGFGNLRDGTFSTVAHGAEAGMALTFVVYDDSEGTTHTLPVEHTLLSPSEIVLGGCTAPDYLNYDLNAELDISNCVACEQGSAVEDCLAWFGALTTCYDSYACEAGSCTPSEPVDCDDGDPCTLDSCDVATGGCLHEPSGDCDTGAWADTGGDDSGGLDPEAVDEAADSDASADGAEEAQGCGCATGAGASLAWVLVAGALVRRQYG